MDDRLMLQLLKQIILQCEFALQAEIDIHCCLNRGNVYGAFYGIQNLLNATANIDKAIVGSRGKKKIQRDRLVKCLEFKDSSMVSEATLIRNDNEHYDERIEVWSRESKHKSLADINVMTAANRSLFTPRDRFRGYDPITGDISFWERTINMPKLTAEIRQILRLAETKAIELQYPPFVRERLVSAIGNSNQVAGTRRKGGHSVPNG